MYRELLAAHGQLAQAERNGGERQHVPRIVGKSVSRFWALAHDSQLERLERGLPCSRGCRVSRQLQPPPGEIVMRDGADVERYSVPGTECAFERRVSTVERIQGLGRYKAPHRCGFLLQEAPRPSRSPVKE